MLVTSKDCHIDSIELMIGGQASDYPAKHVVSLEEAMTAAKAFYDAGGFECGVGGTTVKPTGCFGSKAEVCNRPEADLRRGDRIADARESGRPAALCRHGFCPDP